MILSEISIRRPVFALVLSILITIFGLICFLRLPIRELPDVSRPLVSISITYTGASPEVMESRVTKIVEDELSTLSGVVKISSISRNGKTWIGIEFNEHASMLSAVSDVRDAVSRARKKLPSGIDEPVVARDSGEGEVVLWLNLSSKVMNRIELSDYAERFVVRNISMLDGVSQVTTVGALEKVMYIRLLPARMTALGVSVEDIISAIGHENIELPSGEIRNDDMYFPVEIKRVYVDAESFALLPIRHDGIEGTIRLRDVAEVGIQAKNEESVYHRNGMSSIGIGIVPMSTANPLDVAASVRKKVQELKRFVPEGSELEVDFDSTVYIRNSISEVYETLALTALLVILVLYLFIGSWRTTLIPAVTVPVSLIAAFTGAYFAGFSINLITLLSLILAIGLVVDDAIVMVENISYHIMRGMGVLAASWKGAQEVGFAIVATTLVLIMIFLPLIFMQGITGAMFIEFAVMMSLAVFFSGVIALTLSPALSSIFLKPLRTGRKAGERAGENTEDKAGKICQNSDKEHCSENHAESGTENGVEKTAGNNGDDNPVRFFNFIMKWLLIFYEKTLLFFLRRLWLYPAILTVIVSAVFLFYDAVPHQFVPKEDRGVIYIYAGGGEGTSIHRMKREMSEIERFLLTYLETGEVSSVSFSSPSLGAGTDQSGFVVIQLAPWDKRKKNSHELMREIKNKLTDVPGLTLHVYEPGFKGTSGSPVKYVVKGNDYRDLHRITRKLIADAVKAGILINADTNYSENTPEVEVTIKVDKAAVLGVPLLNISQALQTSLGGTSHTTFADKGEEYDVYIRAPENQFRDINSISTLNIRAANGEMVPLGSVASFDLKSRAKKLPHFDRDKAITISAHPASGVSLGQALDWMDKWSSDNLEPSMSVALNGESRHFRESENELAVVLGLAVLVAYLVLAAQFESFLYPVIVMVTIPLGLSGGLMGLWIMNISLNIYSEIGLLLLIGMVTKNGILIVEFANQLRRDGESVFYAVKKASLRRLKPILMTSLTAIIGALPLILAKGSGYESRQALGAVIFYGMGTATLITVFVVPGIYLMLAGFAGIPGEHERRLKEELGEYCSQDSEHNRGDNTNVV